MVDRIYSLPNYKNSLLEILNKQRCPNSQEEFKAGFGNLYKNTHFSAVETLTSFWPSIEG